MRISGEILNTFFEKSKKKTNFEIKWEEELMEKRARAAVYYRRQQLGYVQ